MSQPQTNVEELAAELGKALGLIHRVLPRLDEPARAAEIYQSLGRASSIIDAVRAAYATNAQPGDARLVATAVDAEIAAVIAAAISVVLTQPYRLVSVQKVSIPVSPANVWAQEGRSDIFHSHRVR